MLAIDEESTWRHDTQHNDTQLNDPQHNDTQLNDPQHNDTQHNDTQHNDTQHNNIQHNDTQLNDTQRNNIQHNTLVIVTLSTMKVSIKTFNAELHYAECLLCGVSLMLNVTNKSVMLRVIILTVVMLNVVGPVKQ
jgi:hypothetical protein